MRTVTVFDLATGQLGSVFTLPNSASVEAQVPDGFGFVHGQFDRMSQRFDLVARKIVDHQPPKPDDDHEWRAENPTATDRFEQRWRWLKKPDVLEREIKSANLLREIEEIEKRQVRSISDLLADPNDAEARHNFDMRKAQISALREQRDGLAKTPR